MVNDYAKHLATAVEVVFCFYYLLAFICALGVKAKLNSKETRYNMLVFNFSEVGKHCISYMLPN
jgi:hypothetical protein